MNNILDLLYDYSKSEKKIDDNFINYVTKIIIKEKDLEEYVTKIKYKNLKIPRITQNGLEIFSMAYDYKKREMLVSKLNIEFLYQILYENLKNSKFDDFEKHFYCNSMILCGLLHEAEHANQHKKINLKNNNFENLLLFISNYILNEFNKKGKVAQFFVGFDKKLVNDSKLIHKLKTQYSTLVPEERMANIYAFREIQHLLEKVRGEIPNVIDELQSHLISLYLKGYDFDKTISSPTERYLEDLNNLNLSKKELYFNQNLKYLNEKEKRNTLENRLTLGLNITSEEYSNIKKLKYKNDRIIF